MLKSRISIEYYGNCKKMNEILERKRSDMKFTTIITRDKNSNWKCVVWQESVEALGTGKSVKVAASIEEYNFQATFLPVGGMHMLPLRAEVLKAIKRDVGDTITVEIELVLK